jgi:hypothetical protein
MKPDDPPLSGRACTLPGNFSLDAGPVISRGECFSKMLILQIDGINAAFWKLPLTGVGRFG